MSLNYIVVPGIGDLFRRVAQHAEFDASEMSASTYFAMLDQGDRRFVAIPVFPSRSFRHGQVYVNSSSGIEAPQDLAGREVGVLDFQMTAAIWIRAFLQHDYGVATHDIRWRTGGLRTPEFAERMAIDLPGNIELTGRAVEDIDVACYIIFSVDQDGDAARAAARRLIAHYLMRIPDTIRFEFAGLDIARMQSVQAGLKAAFAENRLGPAVDAIDDDVVAALAVAGTPDECIAGLRPYAAAGLKTPVLYHVLGPDRMASIDLIADRVRPALLG